MSERPPRNWNFSNWLPGGTRRTARSSKARYFDAGILRGGGPAAGLSQGAIPRESQTADSAVGDAADREPEPTLDSASPVRGPPGRASPDRRLIVTVLVSLGLHLAAVTALLLFLHAGVPATDEPAKPAEVELVMEEHAGDTRPDPPQAPVVTPHTDAKAEPKPPDAPPPAEVAAQSPVTPPPVDAQPDTPEETAEPIRKSEPAPAQAENRTPVPEQQPREPSPAQADTGAPVHEARSTPDQTQAGPPPAPTITLHGTDSPSDARAWGDHILPAAPDAVFHNRPPEYPREAAENGQHGAVVLVIHIAPSGRPAGVDVMRSSGYVLLDRAAREAVMRWRFLPAVKDGQPVASDMKMGFVFDYE